MKPYRQLIREMWRRDRMLPNVDLDSLIGVGSYGRVEDGVFTPRGTLGDRGISFRAESTASEGVMRYASASGYGIQAKAAGELLEGSGLPLPQAGLRAQFGWAGRFVFHADGCREEQLVAASHVADQVKALFRAGKWEREWFLVTKVRRVKSAALLVASSWRAAVDLAAKVPVTGVELGRADLAFRVFAEHDMTTTRLVHAEGDEPTVTVGFRVAGFKRNKFAEPPFEGSLESLAPEQLEFGVLGLEEIDEDFLGEDVLDS